MPDKRKSLYYLMLILLAGAIIFYSQHKQLFERYIEFQDSEDHSEQLTQELEVLKSNEDRLERYVEELNSDPLEMEATIRKNKGLVRSGETVYHIKVKEESST